MPVDEDFPYARFGAHFSGRVAFLARRAGLSPTQLEKATGMPRGTAWKLRRGQIENPSLALMLALQRALGLGTLEELLGDVPSQNLAEILVGDAESLATVG